MEDRYLCDEQTFKRLCADYEEHGSLFIAFDFDNTVFDYHKVGDTFPELEGILAECKRYGMKLILFTANEGESLKKCVEYCEENGFEPDFVNENPITKTRKPYYNILLDDRAGLSSAYNVLKRFLKNIEIKPPRNNSLVKFDFDSVPSKDWAEYPFVKGETYIFIGEIPNMEGHCIVLDYKKQKHYIGYHTDNFVELTEDEV